MAALRPARHAASRVGGAPAPRRTRGPPRPDRTSGLLDDRLGRAEAALESGRAATQRNQAGVDGGQQVPVQLQVQGRDLHAPAGSSAGEPTPAWRRRARAGVPWQTRWRPPGLQPRSADACCRHRQGPAQRPGQAPQACCTALRERRPLHPGCAVGLSCTACATAQRWQLGTPTCAAAGEAVTAHWASQLPEAGRLAGHSQQLNAARLQAAGLAPPAQSLLRVALLRCAAACLRQGRHCRRPGGSAGAHDGHCCCWALRQIAGRDKLQRGRCRQPP